MSNVVAQTDADTDAVLRRTTTYDYNDMDRVIRVHHPDGSLHSDYEYDSAGNISKVIDAAGHITQYIRDGGGRIIRTIDPMLNVTAMEYDVHDNLTKVTDAAGNVHEYSYDFNNRLLSESRNNGARVRYNYYDLAGKLTQRKEFDGTITTYEYDILNRLWKITYPDGNVATFAYDDASRMVTATNENGTVTIGYDNRNRVSGITDVWNKQILYNYDANGNRTRMTLDGRVTDYTYDNVNALLTMTESGGNGVVYSYDGRGRLSTSTINSMLITTYDHDRLDQLTNLNHRAGANQLANFHYVYDGNQNIDEITDRNGTHQYSYDFNRRLITGTAQDGLAESYSYDAIGNHMKPDGTFPPPMGVSYQYNQNGELAKRVESDSTPQPKTVSYAYDALGRRVLRMSGGQWTRFTYDGDDVVLDQNSDGTNVYYGNGPGVDTKLWYTQQGSGSVFFLRDHLNSTRALVSSSGTIIPGSEIDYDSFGHSTAQIPTRYRYTGREYDPDTELYYYRARWYDPQARRFISEDPIGLSGGINLYAYVRNNPISFIDPLGLLDVHIWNYRGKDVAWGHASITLENGTYISWWPQADGRDPSWYSDFVYSVDAISNQTFEMDKEYEGQGPDKNIKITGLDEAAIEKWWNKFRTSNQWKTLSKNCSTTVADALKAGGADVQWKDVFKAHNMVWNPADVEAFANAINRYLANKKKKN